MKSILIAVLSGYAVIDVVGTIVLLAIARKHPVIRSRLVQGFKLLTGGAYITIHDLDEPRRPNFSECPYRHDHYDKDDIIRDDDPVEGDSSEEDEEELNENEPA